MRSLRAPLRGSERGERGLIMLPLETRSNCLAVPIYCFRGEHQIYGTLKSDELYNPEK